MDTILLSFQSLIFLSLFIIPIFWAGIYIRYTTHEEQTNIKLESEPKTKLAIKTILLLTIMVFGLYVAIEVFGDHFTTVLFGLAGAMLILNILHPLLAYQFGPGAKATSLAVVISTAFVLTPYIIGGWLSNNLLAVLLGACALVIFPQIKPSIGLVFGAVLLIHDANSVFGTQMMLAIAENAVSHAKGIVFY